MLARQGRFFNEGMGSIGSTTFMKQTLHLSKQTRNAFWYRDPRGISTCMLKGNASEQLPFSTRNYDEEVQPFGCVIDVR